MINQFNEAINDLVSEISGWKLNEENYKQFSILLNSILQARYDTAQSLVFNRDFCPVCASKLLATKTIEGQPVIDFLQEVSHCQNSFSDFEHILKEHFFLLFILQKLNETTPRYLVSHLQDFISLKYPTVDKKKVNESFLSLRVTFLGINAMLAELMGKLLDFVMTVVYNMGVDKEVERKIINFCLERFYSSHLAYSAIYDETKDAWMIIVPKFSVETSQLCKDLDLCDPLTIIKETPLKK